MPQTEEGRNTNAYTKNDLLPHHAIRIADSGISPEVAEARRYSSITSREVARELGFSPAQAATLPALLVPIHGVAGGVVTHQIRPDNPRPNKDGKPIKYETPAGSRMAIDVPPTARAALGDPKVPLYITEGVRKADAAVSQGACCIDLLGVSAFRGTNEHGGKTALAEWESIALNGRDVRVVFDSDVMTKPTVRAALDRLTAFLRSRGAQVRWVFLPEGAGGKTGLDDFLAAGHTMADVDELAADALTDPPDDAGEWTPPIQERPAPLAPEAFYGLAGDFVGTVAPHTESDPAALLVQFLAAAGCLMGHGPYVLVEATRHYANLFAAIVGDSAKARKGTSWDHVKGVAERVDSGWTANRIIDGIGSGQALIEAVRDGMPDPATGTVAGGEPDKRTLVQAPEFAALLAAQKIESSTLSAVLRNAWDSGRLQTRKRGDVLTATGAHIAVIAHITRPELLRVMSDTESTNGYANRFLWVAATRSKELPFGGDLDSAALNPVVTGLHAAIAHARTVGAVGWTEEARDVWRQEYHDLSAAKPGMVGAVTARGEAQVLRLALVYTLLDCQTAFDVPHLQAALAVWQYCEESARWVFGDRVGDAMADTILTALRDAGAGGLTRTDISALFGRHANGGRLTAALTTLSDAKLARYERTGTGGRPIERWYAMTANAKEAKKGEISREDEGGEDLIRVNSLLSPSQETAPLALVDALGFRAEVAADD